MNYISLHGRIAKDATTTLINNGGIETPLVSFSFQDSGTPYQKNEPMFIEVHFMKEAAMHILPYLKKGKEVEIFGCLRLKNFITSSGIKSQKYFISADYIILTGNSARQG
ncbi:single-stranded DNA-binding protein [uncultured Treponema sp.]|uniref:single-stranded DNA-binding protein n=1 Tax=uncultured Treponema sp. TaxID=162155 RepID=UPI0015B8F8E7|nr:single-stranded DNA-binding protein [uncultured Treponema sp.]